MGVAAVIGYIIAIALSLQGIQLAALIFLVVALADTIATFFVYRTYAALRGTRWHDELRLGEEKMQQMLAEESEKAKRD
jgi:mannose/fructose/N-acetylgalactosamine-specific phosphotransferase system component IID